MSPATREPAWRATLTLPVDIPARLFHVVQIKRACSPPVQGESQRGRFPFLLGCLDAPGHIRPRVQRSAAFDLGGGHTQAGVDGVRSTAIRLIGAVTDHAPQQFGIVMPVLQVLEGALKGSQLTGQVHPAGLAGLPDHRPQVDSLGGEPGDGVSFRRTAHSWPSGNLSRIL